MNKNYKITMQVFITQEKASIYKIEKKIKIYPWLFLFTILINAAHLLNQAHWTSRYISHKKYKELKVMVQDQWKIGKFL